MCDKKYPVYLFQIVQNFSKEQEINLTEEEKNGLMESTRDIIKTAIERYIDEYGGTLNIWDDEEGKYPYFCSDIKNEFVIAKGFLFPPRYVKHFEIRYAPDDWLRKAIKEMDLVFKSKLEQEGKDILTEINEYEREVEYEHEFKYIMQLLKNKMFSGKNKSLDLNDEEFHLVVEVPDTKLALFYDNKVLFKINQAIPVQNLYVYRHTSSSVLFSKIVNTPNYNNRKRKYEFVEA